jgi:multidrug efflux pump subunit AcrA (membrane-fusion protein)
MKTNPVIGLLFAFDQTASTFAVNQASLELKRRQLRDARVIAPFDGIVAARQISPGQVVSRSTTLTWLVDLDIVKVDLAERFHGHPKPVPAAPALGEVKEG